MKIIGYRFSAFEKESQLNDWVNLSIKEGWQPYGSPQMSIYSGTTLGDSLRYGQAIVKYDGSN
jgi:hypothetical protein